MTTPVPEIPAAMIEFGDIASWLIAAIAVAALVVSVFSIVEARRARTDVRKYNDPYFQLEVADEQEFDGNGTQLLRLQLVNRSTSPAREVKLVFDFDPTNLFVGPLFWPLIDRKMSQQFQTRIELPEGPLDEPHWYRKMYVGKILTDPSRRGGLVTWVSPSGEPGEQRVELPHPSAGLRPTPIETSRD